MSDGLSALFWGIITFSLLVLIHEGGHFAAARMFGVKVHEFMIGLPGPALRLHGKKTVYGITAIPLGGYVRIAGMEPGPENPLLGPALAAATRRGTIDADQLAQDLGVEIGLADDVLVTLADWDAVHAVEGEEFAYRSRFAPDEADDPVALLDRARQSTYRALPTWKRLVVLSAGVVMNLLTAVLVFTIVLSAFGYMKETGRLGEVNPGSGAAEAGIKAGDRLVSIGGSEIGSWQDVVLTIGRYQPGDEVTVVVSRGGKTLALQATLGKRPGSSQALLGVSPELVATTPNVLQAVTSVLLLYRDDVRGDRRLLQSPDVPGLGQRRFIRHRRVLLCCRGGSGRSARLRRPRRGALALAGCHQHLPDTSARWRQDRGGALRTASGQAPFASGLTVAVGRRSGAVVRPDRLPHVL